MQPPTISTHTPPGLQLSSSITPLFPNATSASATTVSLSTGLRGRMLPPLTLELPPSLRGSISTQGSSSGETTSAPASATAAAAVPSSSPPLLLAVGRAALTAPSSTSAAVHPGHDTAATVSTHSDVPATPPLPFTTSVPLAAAPASTVTVDHSGGAVRAPVPVAAHEVQGSAAPGGSAAPVVAPARGSANSGRYDPALVAQFTRGGVSPNDDDDGDEIRGGGGAGSDHHPPRRRSLPGRGSAPSPFTHVSDGGEAGGHLVTGVGVPLAAGVGSSSSSSSSGSYSSSGSSSSSSSSSAAALSRPDSHSGFPTPSVRGASDHGGHVGIVPLAPARGSANSGRFGPMLVPVSVSVPAALHPGLSVPPARGSANSGAYAPVRLSSPAGDRVIDVDDAGDDSDAVVAGDGDGGGDGVDVQGAAAPGASPPLNASPSVP